jgi:glutathione S-transferase
LTPTLENTMSIKLHRHPLSGHSHRAQLALSLMGVPHELVEVDLMNGAHKAPEFLKLSPFGQVPVLDDNGTIVFDSNAILVYLVTQYDADRVWLPRDPKGQADVQAWLSVAAGQIAFGPAAARLITVFGAKYNPEDVIGRAHGLLKMMDAQLASRTFLVGTNATLADIAGYSDVAAAPEGNVDLSTYPNVRAWLARVEALPGFVPFQNTAVGLAA